MEVESTKVDPSFSIRTTTPFPPLDWFAGDQSGFMGLSLERLTLTAAASPYGDGKMCVGPSPPVLVDEMAPLKVPFSRIVGDWVVSVSTSLTVLKTQDAGQ